MHFQTMSDFFAMGGYALYVWAAVGLTFIPMLILLVHSISSGRKTLNEIQARQARQARIKAADQALQNGEKETL